MKFTETKSEDRKSGKKKPELPEERYARNAEG